MIGKLAARVTMAFAVVLLGLLAGAGAAAAAEGNRDFSIDNRDMSTDNQIQPFLPPYR